MKYFNQIALLSTLLIGFIACGDSTSDTSTSKSESQTAKASTIKPFIKKYAIKSAKIEYEIKGSMNIMGSTSQTMGTKNLTFSDYGSHELTKVHKVETQNMMGEKREIKTDTLEYTKEATLYKVDFDKKRISRMPIPKIAMFLGLNDEDIVEKAEKIMEGFGGKKIGTDKVLGYTCDVWSLMGSQQCLYKGIPLKIESNVLGVKSSEIAIKATFDTEVDKQEFKLPEFPIINEVTRESIDKSSLAQMDEKDKKDALLESKKMTELKEAIQEGQDTIKAKPNMSNEEQKEVMIEAVSRSKGVQSQFEKMKNGMPKMVEAMKFGKQCLTNAESKAEAKVCMEKTEALIKESGIDEDDDEEQSEDFSWSKEEKKQIIAEIDEGLKALEKSLPCIQKANNMMDMMQCHQE